ncbi:hypothetical protein [Neobacillus mesonae]|uniref:hypothetical protein n=1 Tax=Neobacillus mesonae TaxID=1193713 RepID=UPI002572ABAC|nr:hypothetical protein [Neobacillus mesonae]
MAHEEDKNGFQKKRTAPNQSYVTGKIGDKRFSIPLIYPPPMVKSEQVDVVKGTRKRIRKKTPMRNELKKGERTSFIEEEFSTLLETPPSSSGETAHPKDESSPFMEEESNSQFNEFLMMLAEDSEHVSPMQEKVDFLDDQISVHLEEASSSFKKENFFIQVEETTSAQEESSFIDEEESSSFQEESSFIDIEESSSPQEESSFIDEEESSSPQEESSFIDEEESSSPQEESSFINEEENSSPREESPFIDEEEFSSPQEGSPFNQKEASSFQKDCSSSPYQEMDAFSSDQFGEDDMHSVADSHFLEDESSASPAYKKEKEPSKEDASQNEISQEEEIEDRIVSHPIKKEPSVQKEHLPIVKLPVVLAKLIVSIDLIETVDLYIPIETVSKVKWSLQSYDCKVILPATVVFLKGILAAEVQYVNKGSFHTVKIPITWSKTTKVDWLYPPKLPTKSKKEFLFAAHNGEEIGTHHEFKEQFAHEIDSELRAVHFTCVESFHNCTEGTQMDIQGSATLWIDLVQEQFINLNG